jgi:hypothetical protein
MKHKVPPLHSLALRSGRDDSKNTTGRSGSQIHHVDVYAEADVVCQVPADVVGIFVDDDVVAIPEPAVAKADVVRSDAEIEAAEPEAAGTASGQMPYVAGAETAGKVAVLPRMIEVVVGIVGTGIVADPFAVGVNVGGVGMAFVVVEMSRGLMGSMHWCRTVSWNIVFPADVVVLGYCVERKQQADCECCEQISHIPSNLLRVISEFCFGQLCFNPDATRMLYSQGSDLSCPVTLAD